jgi:hypothetical protein
MYSEFQDAVRKAKDFCRRESLENDLGWTLSECVDGKDAIDSTPSNDNLKADCT